MTDEVAAPAGGEQSTTGGMFNTLSGGAAPTTDNAAPAEPQQTAAPVEETWFSKFQDEGIREYLQHKGFKDPEALAHSYQSLEKMNGVPSDELFRVRADMSEEDTNKLYNRLGRPEDASKYSIEAGEDDIPALTDWFKQAAYKSGMSDSSAKAMYGEFNEQIQNIAAEQTQAIDAKNAQEVGDLVKSWGSKADYTKSVIDRAGEYLGVTPEILQSVKASGQAAPFMQMMAKIGNVLSEGKTIEPGMGRSSFNGKTVSEAKNEIAQLQRDTNFMNAYFNKESPTHKQAVQQMMDLNQVIVNSRN
jgi:hypothetical protein